MQAPEEFIDGMGKRWSILGPTLLIALITLAAVQLITPRYQSETRVLVEGRDNIFLRPDADKDMIDRNVVDQEAVTSQAQVVMSREVANQVIERLKLDQLPEFDPALNGVSPIKVGVPSADFSRVSSAAALFVRSRRSATRFRITSSSAHLQGLVR